MERPVILYRDAGIWTKEEEAAASKYFPCTRSRMDIVPGNLVIGRYSVLPFYKEQERDVSRVGARLINSYRQHRYIADMRAWLCDLEDLTPRTWFSLRDVPIDYPGSLVVKGETNSKKFLWDTHMFAKTRKDAVQVQLRLMDDSLIGSQELYFREFEEFEVLGEGLNGLPVTTEFRFFVAYGEVLSGAFYWASNTEDLNEVPSPTEVPKKFIQEVINRVGDQSNFYVIDVARRRDGEWRVVELNDGQMSGLSDNNPEILYMNLHKCLQGR